MFLCLYKYLALKSISGGQNNKIVDLPEATLYIANMSTYNIHDFAKKVNCSVRTVRRYVKEGKAPSGKIFEPLKKGNKYIFSETHVSIWQDDKADVSVKKSNDDNLVNLVESLVKSINENKEQYKTIARLEVESESLRQSKEQLEKDFQDMQEQYIEKKTLAESSLQDVERLKQELETTKAELNKERYKTIWQRIFNR